MTTNPLLKRMLDAGVQFTETSQEHAEKLVREFVKVGQARRKDSEELARQVVERGRYATMQLVAMVQAEVTKQVGRLASRIEEMEGLVEDMAHRLGITKPPSKPAAPTEASPAKKAPAKKAPAKKAPAKKTPAKKAAAKKAPAKKAPAKKAAAKKASASTAPVRKIALKKPPTA